MGESAAFDKTKIADQSGKVFIVTGSNSGVGELVAGILFSKNAKVYVAARSSAKAEDAIKRFKSQYTQSKGALVFLKLDLNDLTTIKSSAEEFMSKESRLDVLWNNAGVMIPPQGSKTVQGYELQLGVNNLGPFLFTQLLIPVLKATAKAQQLGGVRVVWVSSSAAKRYAPKGGVDITNLDYKQDQEAWHKYGVSKAGNTFQAAEFASRYAGDGIFSVSLDPGNLKTNLYQNFPVWQRFILPFVLKDPILGAYTELYAGFSPDITADTNGGFIESYGKLGHTREDVEASWHSGTAKQFWEWCAQQVAPYV